MKLKGNTRSIPNLAGWAIFGCMLLPLTSFGALFPVTQNSVPAGLVSQSAIIEGGQTYQSIDPQLNKNGYTFGYWAIDGVRQAGADGRSLTRVSGVIEADSNFTAHYYADNADTDGDGVMDWFEYRMFGDLSKNPSDDSDGDGFTNKRESELGQDALIVDFMEAGGIAGRMSNSFTYADTSMQVVTIKSDPTGFITTSITNKELNATVTTQSLNGATNGSHFAYWTINGVRQASPNGVASSKVSLNISGDTNIVAHYVPSTQDTDGDGVMDWFEFYQFGNLNAGPEDDSDGDGFSNNREGELGQEATIAEFTEAGGIAGRMSNTFTYADTSTIEVTIKSNPAGFITTSVTNKEVNATVNTQSLNGATNGSHFAYWTINGVRQASPNGVASSKVSLNISGDTNIVAHYVPSTQDTDGDGVMDWFEKYQFGNLDLGPNDDPDGDGYTNKREGELGQEAAIAEFTESGGIAGRMSNSVTYYVQQNRPPSNLELNNTIVFLNKDANQTVGTFTPTDPDDPGRVRTYTYQLLGGAGGEDNNKFNLLGRNLRASQTLTSEGNFSIQVRVRDDENASFDKNFTIRAIDPLGDHDGDGLGFEAELAAGTNPNNADTDGDGANDGAEVSAGKDPLDPTIFPNRPPRDLNSSAVLAFSENQPVGTIIGEFNATDPDGDAITYHFVSGENNNSLFNLDTNGTLKSATTFDYESNASIYIITVQAKDELNATTEGNFTVTLLDDDTEDRDGDGFTDGQEAEAGTNPDSNTSIPGLGYSLVAWYPFDGNASDMSGNEHHGMINGATLGFDRHGEANKCYSFDGINDSIRATYTGSQYLFEEVSFGAWVKVKRIVADEAIIDLGGFYLNVLGSGRGNEGGTLEFGSGNWLYPQWASNFSNSASVDDQIWNQIFGIYDGKSLLVYKNGQLIKNRSSTTTNPTISFDLSIGKNKNGSRPAEGLIDEVRIYNRALLPREIFELYNLEKPNMAPSNLGSATPLTIGENQSIGTLVSNFNATDPDGDAITYHFINEENNNSLFTLDSNGTLKTATTFDYESNASSYTLTVQAKDELNATTEGNFTVTLEDIFEDLDQDGTADHLDDDMDGDGFTNVEELAIGSDPRSAVGLPLNDSNFHDAIALWFDAEANATATYGHISDWNVSAVTSMVRAFENQISFNEDISNWDVSQVTQTNSMFRGATAFNQPIGDWNVSKVSLTSNMFHDASSFDQPIDKWDVAQVTNMTNMFKGAFVFNQPIGDWNVSSVTSMGSMFYDAKAFNQPIGNWDVSKVTMMNSMFRGASSFNQAIGDWNVSATTNMAAMFYDASNFDQAIGNWDVSRVSSMMNMFRGATLFNQPIGDWNVSAVTSMASLFYDAKEFNQSLGQWDVSGATVMNSMFRWASSFNQSIEDWDISQVTNTNGMFGGADNLENITKRKIHKTFSSNQNWEYDWRPHLANSSPIDLNTTTGLTLYENDPVGTFINIFNATDPEGDAITFSLAKREGSEAPYPFQLEQNGTLRAAKSFDYETDEHKYNITVVAKDEYNATTEGNFTVTLLNVYEDLDQDGIEDHLDDDIDGDGFTNAEEITYGSDPRDENSVADTPSTALTLDNLQILENQPIGTVVGKFTVIAPNPDDVHRVMFSQLDQNDSHNHLFIIDANNSLRTAVVFDFENNSSDIILRVKVRQGQVEVFRESFTLSLLNDPTDDVVTDNNGTQPFVDHNETSDDNNTQHPIHDGNGSVDGNHTLPTWDDHNNTKDDNGTLPPVTDPDSDQDTNPYAWIPIIHTDHPQILEDGRIQLSGRVLYDGGGTMSEFGFLLSPTLRIPLNSPDTLKLEANGTAGSFTLIIPESPYARRLYVQAYSTNEAGMGVGQRRRLKIPEPPAKWWGEALHGEGGWLESPWFGAFKYYEQGWLFHAELGWLYSSPVEDGVWLWGSDNQWLWTKDGIYPYHYRWNDAAWGIWQKTAKGSIRTYNYGTGDYEN